MVQSLVRSGIALIALVVLYQAYLLTVSPWVEPAGVVRSDRTITETNRDDSYSAVDRYQQFLAAYFPSNHWSQSQTKPPKVIRVNQMMMVLSDYRRGNDGSIEFDQCALLMLPTTWVAGSPPPREAIVIESEQGASLLFDEDFQPARGKMGRIVKGELPGKVVIRSDMQEAGPHDDLLITTHDLVMNETLIRTESQVEARLGGSRLLGTRMDIRLSRDEHIPQGPSINGVQSLEIFHNVRMRLDVGDSKLLGGGGGDRVVRQLPAANEQANNPIRLVAAQQGVARPNPPIEVSCQGRLYIDMLRFIASFEQQVEVRRERLEGPYDQLDCNELSIHFGAVDDRGLLIDLGDDPNVARKQSQAAGKLRPIALVATGSPVRADAPVEGASMRGQNLQIDLLKQRIAIHGGQEVLLTYGPNRIHAPFIEYTIPPKESTAAVGDLALSGPGWLRAVPDEARADRVIDIVWQEVPQVPYPVQMRRERGQPVLLLQGSPVIDAHRLGRVKADRLELSMREVPADGPEGPAFEVNRSPTKLAVIPERMLAAGRVEFQSPELNGRTHQLSATFLSGPGEGASGTETTAGGSQQGTTRLVSDSEGGPSTVFDISASQIHLDLSLAGKRAQPTAATCDGSVLLRQVKTPKPGDAPLVVTGDRLEVKGLDDQARITVFGRGNGSQPGDGLATVEAQGMAVSARQVHADQAAGKFWVDGGGQAVMQVDGEMLGQPQGTPTPVTLTWQKSLRGEGQRVTIDGRVQVVSQQSLIQADRAVATLNQPLSMARDTAKGDKLEVAEVGLEGNVVIDYRSHDAAGQQSHENLQLAQVSINRLTGEIKGTGPGALRSIRLGDPLDNLGSLGNSNPSTSIATQPTQPGQLQFLRVDFAQGMSGNLHQRVVRFHRRVRSVYGPIANWQQELTLHDPSRLPPDAVTLNCEMLVISEDPHAARLLTRDASKVGPIELQAVENVEIEGRDKKNNLFQAQAVKATYNQAKNLFVLEGDGHRDAVLRRQEQGARFGQQAARKIMYFRDESRVQIDGFRHFDFQQSAARPTTP